MPTGKEFAAKCDEAYECRGGYIWGTMGETWTAAKQNALANKKSSNYDLAKRYGAKWIGKRVWDCSGLPKYAAKAFGINIPHGSNSIWDKGYLSAKGEYVAGMKLPIGALVFCATSAAESADQSHVGVTVTETCVVEARGTQQGVCHTPLSNKKWKLWGLLKGVDYDFVPSNDLIKSKPVKVTAPKNSSAGDIPKTLQRGDKCEEVARMQRILLVAGMSLPKYGVDGSFGAETQKALKKYQSLHNLTADGICGPETWKTLLAYKVK